MKIKSITVFVAYLLLLPSFTVPAIACPPPYCGDCYTWNEVTEECEWDCAPGQCCSGGWCVDDCGEGGTCCSGNCCSNTCCFSTCCGAGQNCCSHDCCSNTCCYGTCCDAGQGCCGGSCCSNACCTGTCCDPGETCCGSICCISDCCSGSGCCGAVGKKCCDDLACYDPATEKCCGDGNGTVCNIDEVCCNGMCCPEGQCCNEGVCVSSCPSGKCCSDGTCVSSCPGGECCDDGTCVSSCPSGECCDDGTCVPDCDAEAGAMCTYPTLPGIVMCKMKTGEDYSCDNWATGPGYEDGYCATAIASGPKKHDACHPGCSCVTHSTPCVRTYDKVCKNKLFPAWPPVMCKCSDPGGLVTYTSWGTRTVCGAGGL